MITRILSAFTGIGMIAFALTVGQQRFIGLEPGNVGQLTLILLGALLVIVALLGKRLRARQVIKNYQQFAVILLNTILFLVIAELLVILSFNAQFVTRSVRQVPVNQELAVYQDADWLQAYLKEGAEVEKYRYSPYDLWKTQPYQGETINIDAEGRRLTPGSNCQPDSYRIDFYGGSTMWGLGSPDSGTIPAYVQAALADQFGDQVCVLNQGELGYVSTQEVIRLMKQFQHDDAPHLAVFYDGVNDAVAASGSGEAGIHRNLGSFVSVFQAPVRVSPLVQWLSSTYLATFVRGLLPQPQVAATAPVDYTALGSQVAQLYLNNVKMGNALADAYGIQTVFLWQPIMVSGAKPLTTEEQAMTEVIPPDLLTTYQVAWEWVGTIAAAGDPPNLYDLSDVFDGVEAPLYIDHHHLAPQGNQIVAQRIVEIITPIIQQTLQQTQ